MVCPNCINIFINSSGIMLTSLSSYMLHIKQSKQQKKQPESKSPKRITIIKKLKI